MERKLDNERFRIIVSDDGSHTLYSADYGETFHSSFGAVTEATHIFINNGLRFLSSEKEPLNILEIGFGTGLNAFLSLIFSAQNRFRIHYVALDKEMLSRYYLKGLNYSKFVDFPASARIFDEIHKIPEGTSCQLTEHFCILKKEVMIQDFSHSPGYFDLVYFDAFSPEVQPEMWEVDIIKKVFDLVSPGGAFITYSAKGEVKRRLKTAGFVVEPLPGPPGKREITRAVKPKPDS